jgi:3-ketosteroid 9alpha-monooxygenase subunit B
MTRSFTRVTVASVTPETGDAVTFTLADSLTYQPGQFLTVRVPSDRPPGSVARCYSLSSSPHIPGQGPAFTVRLHGYGSRWLAAHVRAGTVLDILPPAGTFTPGTLDGEFLLFAAGSGITPVMSIISSVLHAGSGRLVLIYANRDDRSVIFASALASLASSSGGRLTVVHWLDSLLGLPSAAALTALARPYASWQPFVCGPDPFLGTVRSCLSALGVPSRRVRVERFLSLAENPFEAIPDPGGVAATLTVSLDDSTVVLPWPAGTRMLDVLTEAGLDAPFSCRQGICGACACQLTGGKVDMVHNEVLEDADIADGYVLACQSLAVTPQVSISY